MHIQALFFTVAKACSLSTWKHPFMFLGKGPEVARVTRILMLGCSFLPQGGTWDVADVQWNPHLSHNEYIVSTSSEKL